MERAEAQFSAIPRRALPALVLVGVVVVALVRFDLRVEVTYQVARVVQVQTVTGQSGLDRRVMVDLGGKPRIIRTSDIHISTVPGQRVCVEVNRFLLRRWTRFSLEVPFYCPQLRGVAPNGLSSPSPGLNVSQP